MLTYLQGCIDIAYFSVTILSIHLCLVNNKVHNQCNDKRRIEMKTLSRLFITELERPVAIHYRAFF